MTCENNPYIPEPVEILETWYETGGPRAIKTFKVAFVDRAKQEEWSHKPGQCAMIGVPGIGESMISISCSPTEKGYLRFSVMKMGKVTSYLHQLEAGDKFFVRGPYGNNFPVDDWKGKNILTVGGGIGQAPLRPIINYVRHNRGDYEDLTILYGARTSEDHCFKEETEEFMSCDDICCTLAVDIEEEKWDHYVGFVPQMLLDTKPSPENTIAITCGPPIMIKFVLQNLEKLGFVPSQIYTTLENRMKCGIGKCGRCNVGQYYVCKDGPVFCYELLKGIPEAFE